jgi:hypothetical protein
VPWNILKEEEKEGVRERMKGRDKKKESVSIFGQIINLTPIN